MQEKIIIGPDCCNPNVVCHEISRRAHFQSRGLVSLDEMEDIDGRTVLTIDFRDPLDANHFRSWLSSTTLIAHRDHAP
jgi:hypothetical protein